MQRETILQTPKSVKKERQQVLLEMELEFPCSPWCTMAEQITTLQPMKKPCSHGEAGGLAGAVTQEGSMLEQSIPKALHSMVQTYIRPILKQFLESWNH